MSLPDKPPPIDYQTIGTIGGFCAALYGFLKARKEWPNRINGSKREILERLSKAEHGIAHLESRLFNLEENVKDGFSITDGKLDKLDNRLFRLGRRFNAFREEEE